MTLDELYKPIKDAMDSGLGDLNVFVKEFGKSSEQTINPVEFVNIVSSYSSGERESFIEVVYKNYSKDKQEDIKKFNDIQIQSYRNERRLIFDAWEKRDRKSFEIINKLLKYVDMDKCIGVVKDAEAYLKELSKSIPPLSL